MRIVDEYSYRDEEGRILYQVVRLEPKDFRTRRPDGHGGWIWSLGNTRRVLFRLPELLASDPSLSVFFCEGEKDVLNLARHDLVAITNLGGTRKWREDYCESLRGRRVVVLPDNDVPGRDHALDVSRSLHGVVASIKILGLPGLPEKGDVSDWLRSGGTREELERLVAETAEWEPETMVTSVSTRHNLPQIITTDRPMRDVTADAVEALIRGNDPPRFFVRSGSLVRVRLDEAGRPIADTLGEAELRGALERSADFQRVRRGKEAVSCAPPLEIVRDTAALGSWDLPQLEAVIETPALRPDGTVLDRPGYDPQTRLYYTPASNLRLPALREVPTAEDIAAAGDLLSEALEGFPFVGEASRANALALMLTPIVRPAVQGLAPLALIDAPAPGTGKTLLAELVGIVTTRNGAAMMPALTREEEWEKRITALLAAGTTLVVIDNLEHPLASQALHAALTGQTWQGRILGQSRMITLPQRCTWIATGNNIRLGGDLPRRCYWIRIDSRTSRPWQRNSGNFKHPGLLKWAREKRGELIGALLTLARAWYARGQPPAESPTLGGFDSWAQTVGGILAVAGVPGFLTNLSELYDKMDEASQQWESFLRALLDVYGREGFTVSRIVADLGSTNTLGVNENVLRDALPDELADALARDADRKGGGSFPKRLGKALRKREDVRHGEDGIHLERAGQDTHRGTVRWRVCGFAGLAGLPSSLRGGESVEQMAETRGERV